MLTGCSPEAIGLRIPVPCHGKGKPPSHHDRYFSFVWLEDRQSPHMGGGGGETAPHSFFYYLSETKTDSDTILAIPLRTTISHIVTKIRSQDIIGQRQSDVMFPRFRLKIRVYQEMILTNVNDTIHADSLALFELNIEILFADVTKLEKSNILNLTWPVTSLFTSRPNFTPFLECSLTEL